MAAFASLGTRAATSCGRVPVMTAIEMCGTALLALIAFLADRGANAGLLVALHLVRTGLMNCCYPLEDSVLMDFVPKKTRARWQALDSVSSAT